MANVIKLRKGLDVNLKGKAAKEEFQVKKPAVYALMPDDFTGMKPKVVVKENDVVKVGDSLFVDKNHPEIKFVSPVSGRVTMVERGDRRKVLSVRVEADAEQQYVDFGKKNVGQMTAQEVKDPSSGIGLVRFLQATSLRRDGKSVRHSESYLCFRFQLHAACSRFRICVAGT